LGAALGGRAGGGCDDEISSTITALVMKGTRGGDSEGPVSVEVNVQQTAFIMLLIAFLSGTAKWRSFFVFY
jgi:hypothetical protein